MLLNSALTYENSAFPREVSNCSCHSIGSINEVKLKWSFVYSTVKCCIRIFSTSFLLLPSANNELCYLGSTLIIEERDTNISLPMNGAGSEILITLSQHKQMHSHGLQYYLINLGSV